MVTICTASLTFNNSTFCPHSVFMCFVWISEQTAIISLYNINWLVFVTETQSVYSAVRTGSSSRVQIQSRLFRGLMTSPTCGPESRSASRPSGNQARHPHTWTLRSVRLPTAVEPEGVSLMGTSVALCTRTFWRQTLAAVCYSCVVLCSPSSQGLSPMLYF